jgi:hypothetical protein
MRCLTLLPLILAPCLAQAEAQLLIAVTGDVRVTVDGAPVGHLGHEGFAPMLIRQPGRHALRVESHGGTLLAERSIDLDDGETLAVRWDGERLAVETLEATRTQAPPAQQRPSALQAAQAGSTVASVLAPGNPVVSGVSTGLAVARAGDTLVQAARAGSGLSRDTRAPPSTATSYADHDLDSLRRGGVDPYAAAGGRPSVDATMASVTFVTPPGTGALISIAGQPVASLGANANEATVLVVPGMHRVMIYASDGATLLHRGYLTTAAGQAIELRFSATAAPSSSLPDTWR